MIQLKNRTGLQDWISLLHVLILEYDNYSNSNL